MFEDADLIHRYTRAEAIADGVLIDVREGETVRLRLWWSVDRPVTLDYSVGLYMMDSSGQVAQSDGPPQPVGGPQETSRWLAGRYYLDEREITLPYPAQVGSYAINLALYQWWDGKRIAAPGMNSDTTCATKARASSSVRGLRPASVRIAWTDMFSSLARQLALRCATNAREKTGIPDSLAFEPLRRAQQKSPPEQA